MATTDERLCAAQDTAPTGLRDVMEVAREELAKLLIAAEAGEEPEDMLWLWYPRGETVVFGVWAAVPDEDAYEDGDGEWHRGIAGWHLPSALPWVELVFRLEMCEPVLRACAETGASYTAGMLNGAIRTAERHAVERDVADTEREVAALEEAGEHLRQRIEALRPEDV